MFALKSVLAFFNFESFRLAGCAKVLRLSRDIEDVGGSLGTDVLIPIRPNDDAFLSIDQLKPGMILATDVTDTNGRLLLSEGQALASST